MNDEYVPVNERITTVDDGPHTVNERLTVGGPGPEGQDDTVTEHLSGEIPDGLLTQDEIIAAEGRSADDVLGVHDPLPDPKTQAAKKPAAKKSTPRKSMKR